MKYEITIIVYKLFNLCFANLEARYFFKVACICGSNTYFLSLAIVLKMTNVYRFEFAQSYFRLIKI